MLKEFLTLQDKPIEIPGGEPYNIVLFDMDGRIATRVGTDTPFLKKNNFFLLLPEEELSFFREWRFSFGRGCLLLETTRGPALIYSGLWAETGLLAAVVFHTPRETLRGFWQSGIWNDMQVSPYLMERTLPKKKGNEHDLFKIMECVNSLNHLFSIGVTPLPMRDGEWMISTLGMIVCDLARNLGCPITLREARRAELSEAWAFSRPSFVGVMTCLISMVANHSVSEPLKVEIYEEDGRIFVRLETVLSYWRDKRSKAHRFDYEELRECERMAERHDMVFDVVAWHKEEGAALTICFSPQYYNPAFFGLKNPLRFNG